MGSSSPTCPSSTSPNGQAPPRRAHYADDTPYRRERVRHPAGDACDVRREDRAVHPWRVAVRVVDQGIEGFTNVATWWSEPIVFQKAVLYTMLFEVVGLGCCFGPLAGRTSRRSVRSSTGCGPDHPPATLARPGAIHPGNNRTPFDALLYGACSPCSSPRWCPTAPADSRSARRSACCRGGSRPQSWAVLAVLGLRDKVIFLTRPRRGIRAAGSGVPVRRSRHRRRGESGLHGHLAGRGDIETQQALSVRDLDDAGQQPIHPLGFLKRSLFKRLSK